MTNSSNRTTSDADTDRATIRVDSPGELLAAVPYLVGFHPSESLVLIGLADRRVVVTARLDLDDCGEDELHHALTVLGRAGADAAMVACYSDAGVEPWGFPWDAVVGALHELAGWVGMLIVDVLVVRAGRFWAYGVDDASEPGQLLPDRSSMAAASATYAGLVACPDRASLLAVLDQPSLAERQRAQPRLDDHEAAAVRAELAGSAQRHRRSVKRAVFAAARVADRTLPVADDSDERLADLSRFAVGLADIEVRDALWLAVDQGRLDGRPLWRELLSRMPPPYDAAPLFLFGWGCWREGSGTLAVESALRALESDPGYSAAELLLSAVETGLDPHRTPRLKAR